MQRVPSVLISVLLSLWREGAHYDGTTGLSQFTFRNSDVTTFLTSLTYLLLGEQGRGGIGKTAQIFPLRPGGATHYMQVLVTICILVWGAGG